METIIQRDMETVRLMIDLYCRHHLGDEESVERYRQLADYACRRLSQCRYAEQKPACKDCLIHCYRPEMRAMMRDVMRWTGPRMLFYAPRATLRHLWQCVRRRRSTAR